MRSILLAALIFAAAPAHAQTPLAEPGVTAEQAIATARKNGMTVVDDVDRDDGKWEVEGRQANGREIEIDIDIRTGAVLKIERD